MLYFEVISPQNHPKKSRCLTSHFPVLSPDLVWVRLPSITAEWRGVEGERGESWLGSEACSDAEIFLRLGGNHKGGGQSSDLLVKQH